MRSKTPLALMELLVMVLVFALASAICVRIFVRSDEISRTSEAVSRAALEAQDVAEEIKSRRPSFAELYEDEDTTWKYTDGVWELAYDEEWMPVNSDMPEFQKKQRYCLQIIRVPEAVPGLVQVQMVVSDGKKTLFEIPVAWQEVSGHE